MSEMLTPGAAADGSDAVPAAAPTPAPPKRGPGHRGQDIRDTVAEMAAKAHEISLEAGSRMASTMREVIGAAAGISAFAIESARDLVNYMVRRGQMSQDEANKLMIEVEAAHATRSKSEPAAKAVAAAPKAVAKPAPPKAEPAKPVKAAAPVKVAAAPAAKAVAAPAAKAAAKPAAKAATKAAPAKKVTPKKK